MGHGRLLCCLFHRPCGLLLGRSSCFMNYEGIRGMVNTTIYLFVIHSQPARRLVKRAPSDVPRGRFIDVCVCARTTDGRARKDPTLDTENTLAIMKSSPPRYWRRILRSGAVWTGAGAGAGWAAPKLFAASSLVWPAFAPSFITTSAFWVGSLVVLLPLGLARGVLASTMDLVETSGRDSIFSLYASAEKLSSSATKGTGSISRISLSEKEVLEGLTMGGGWRGQVFRTLASPFFPSTLQMMVGADSRDIGSESQGQP